ncbi:MAG: cysteine hydrolase family protein [Methermicoccaceae archaeon]
MEESVQLERKGTMLLVVDMQNDFCTPEGTLYNKPSADIIEPISNLLNGARKGDITIGYTQDWHKKDDVHFKQWSPHCIMHTWGSEIVNELAPLEHEYVFKKEGYSPFHDTDIERRLHENNIHTIIVCGTLANICVLHTVVDALQYHFDVVVPRECTAALNEYDYNYALHHMGDVMGATVCSLDEILDEILF